MRTRRLFIDYRSAAARISLASKAANPRPVSIRSRTLLTITERITRFRVARLYPSE